MIAKEIAGRKGTSSFAGLVAYLTDAQGKAERVGRVQVHGCHSDQLEDALLEVHNVQVRNHRVRDSSYHLVLSWPAGEDLGEGLLEEIERRTVEALGFDEHQRVSVIHRDTDNLHLHLAINRIHPTRGTAHSPSFSKLVLDRLCATMEDKYGLVQTHHQARAEDRALQASESLSAALSDDFRLGLGQADSWQALHAHCRRHGLELRPRGRGLVFASADGAVVRASSLGREMSRGPLEGRLGVFEAAAGAQRGGAPGGEGRAAALPRPPQMEPAAGVESLIGWVQRNSLEALRAAESWTAFHAACRAHGLEAKLRGNGLVLGDGRGVFVKASSVSRELSKHALERRLGAFVSGVVGVADGGQVEQAAQAEATASAGRYEKRPLLARQDEGLYRLYLADQAVRTARRHQTLRRARVERARGFAQLQAASRRRWTAVSVLAKGPVARKIWSAHARLADRRTRQRVLDHHRRAVQQAHAQHGRQGWLPWLQGRAVAGDGRAVELLRRRAAAQSPGADVPGVLVPVDGWQGPSPEAFTRAGTAVFAFAGGSVRDDGQRLSLSPGTGHTTAALAQLLQRAAERYAGRPLGVEGDDQFQKQLVRVAAALGAPITFANPALEQQRRALSQEVARVRTGQPTTGRRGGAEHGGTRADARAARTARGSAASRGGGGAELHATARESHARRFGPQAPAGPAARLRRVSELTLVFHRPQAPGLLPPDALPHVGQRRPQADSKLRRDDERAVTPTRPKGRGRGR
ncbi:MAG: relaxase/mobilization nuclease domain-containing protein [Myxococcales bacterium]|nr:relaxase/mobilization nuclease domain-containing protein [Myxococcales bacterium]